MIKKDIRMNLETKLSQLVQNGTIISFLFQELDDEGNVGHSKFRNSERLVLTFPNGEKLALETFCSGCAEDTSFCLSD